MRTAEQTATALFWNANAVAQYQAALRDQVTRRQLDIVDSARAFALLNASTADALIACWRAKYDDAYWRPITAIQLADTDGNDATEPDPAWTPLTATPPYPDYTSGHACITGATSGTVGTLFGPDSIDLTVPSLAATPARHFATTDALDRGDDERQDLARNPLPQGHDRRQPARSRRRGLRNHPLLPTDKLKSATTRWRMRLDRSSCPSSVTPSTAAGTAAPAE